MVHHRAWRAFNKINGPVSECDHAIFGVLQHRAELHESDVPLPGESLLAGAPACCFEITLQRPIPLSKSHQSSCLLFWNPWRYPVSFTLSDRLAQAFLLCKDCAHEAREMVSLHAHKDICPLPSASCLRLSHGKREFVMYTHQQSV